jgi:hypothetical protein
MRGTYTNDMPNIFGNIPCTIRAAGSPNQSRYVLKGKFYQRAGLSDPWKETMDDTFYSIDGVNSSGGAMVIGVKNSINPPGHERSGVFGPLVASNIAAISLNMSGDDIGVPGPATGGIAEPACGLGYGGYVFYQNLTTVQSTPKIYAVLNSVSVLTGCSNQIYSEANIIILPNKNLDYNVKVRAVGSRMTILSFAYKLSGTYGQPEYQIGH